MSISTHREEVLGLAYTHFSQALFKDPLPPCEVRLTEEAEEVFGFFAPQPPDRSLPRIFMHASFCSYARPVVTMQWLVHEMVHLWQFYYGTPCPDRGHNRQFAQKSLSVGLVPSSTGRLGGARTGPVILDYPVHGGRFDRAVRVFERYWTETDGRPASKDLSAATARAL